MIDLGYDPVLGCLGSGLLDVRVLSEGGVSLAAVGVELTLVPMPVVATASAVPTVVSTSIGEGSDEDDDCKR